MKHSFRIRTVTAFVNLSGEDFQTREEIATKLRQTLSVLQSVSDRLTAKGGYEVQTVRIATNAFGEWIGDAPEDRLNVLNEILEQLDINFCSLGPATCVEEIINICPLILRKSSRFSCSATIEATSVEKAHAAAQVVLDASKFTEFAKGEANFRFCTASSCPAGIPFFPGAKSDYTLLCDDEEEVGFAIGLENGRLAHALLSKCGSLDNVPTIFRQGMLDTLKPIQAICQDYASSSSSIKYLGIDTSLNPALDRGNKGSVAAALEELQQVHYCGGVGSLAAAACITQQLHDLKDEILMIGYCGLMLPVCEDLRLAELASSSKLTVTNLLSISSVCGVGVDTVPLAGNVSVNSLTSLMLDVAGLAGKWSKPLSCRVFPVPGLEVGDETSFESPHLCNAKVFDL